MQKAPFSRQNTFGKVKRWSSRGSLLAAVLLILGGVLGTVRATCAGRDCAYDEITSLQRKPMSTSPVRLILLMILALVMSFATLSSGTALDVLRIGVVVDQTGLNAEIGKDQAAAAWIAGLVFYEGVGGIPLQLIIENARGYYEAIPEKHEVEASFRRLIDWGSWPLWDPVPRARRKNQTLSPIRRRS